MLEKLLLAATMTFALNLVLGLSSAQQQSLIESRQGPLQVAQTSDHHPDSPRSPLQLPNFAPKQFE